jgi:hypothetical protein
MAIEDLKRIYDEKDARITAEERHVKTLQSQQVVSDTIIEATASLIKYLEGRISKTEVMNQLEGFATTEDALNIASKLDKLDESILAGKVDQTPIVDALKALTEETKGIPGQIKIEKTEAVAVTNLDEIKLDNSDVVEAIKGQKLEVNVEAPVINTEKTDTKLVEEILGDIKDAINKQKLVVPDKFKITNLKEIKPTDTTKIETRLEKSNKYLKTISEKSFGGSGGGGRATPYQDNAGIPAFVELVGGKIPVDVDMATEGIATEATLAALLAELNKVLYATEYGATYNYIMRYKRGTTTWEIQRETISTGLREYANGTTALATGWSGRAGATYGGAV